MGYFWHFTGHDCRLNGEEIADATDVEPLVGRLHMQPCSVCVGSVTRYSIAGSTVKARNKTPGGNVGKNPNAK